VPGCFGCKIGTVGFGTVPGASIDSKNQHSVIRQREKDLDRYREKRRAGERPDGTTKKAMDASEKKQDLFERRESDLRDYNPPEAVNKVKRSLTNQ